MTSYSARYAELYDVFYRDKPYAQEAAFIDSILKKFGAGSAQRILDLACGSGTHAIELSSFQHKMTCVDSSAGMLNRAKAKAKAANLDIRFLHQDMRSLRVDGPLFDAAICLFDSIGYLTSDDELDDVFENVGRHLKSEGLFVLEYWHAAAMLRHYEPIRIGRWETESGKILRISETCLNYASQTATVRYTIYELDSNGRYRFMEEVHTNRFFLVHEVNRWLTSKGFVVLRNCAGFSWDETISDRTWHIVTVARNGRIENQI